MAAKKFVPRQRKHKVLARERAQENATYDAPDANSLEILPAQRKEILAEKARIKEELKLGGQKVTSKKAKRLEKYIEKKLRKDEGHVLAEKLEKSKIDTTLFSSTKALGQGKETKKQALRRALLEKKAGIQDDTRDAILFRKREVPSGAAPQSESESEKESEDEDNSARAPSQLHGSTKPSQPATAIGSGLKRPLDVDDHGRPVLKKRQKRGGVATKVSLVHPVQQPAVQNPPDGDDSSDEWGGFSDSDNGNGDGDDDLDIDNSADSSSGEDSEQDSSEGGSSDDSEDSDDDSDDDEDMLDDDDEKTEERQARSSAFKAWAHQQRNEALGYAPVSATETTYDIPKPKDFTPRAPEQDPLPRELLPTENDDRKAFGVIVQRSAEIQEARLKLPVVGEEQRIMEAIHNHDTVVVCGATGSGKTTQIPQFLFEAGYGSPGSPTPGMIGVTQPRRVAAVSMSRRVAEELGEHSHKVAYQIRFEGTANPSTAIKFMTDGVLLREVAQDISLRKYSAIIVDEAHERSVNTDILIGILSRVIKLRRELAQEDPTVKPLKLIIMSATLRVDDMTQNQALFASPPPVVEVEGRQHPVTMHFARRTHFDYVEEAFRKISRGHRKLPPGGFLVFLTGQNEILRLSKKLKAVFCKGQASTMPKVKISASEAPVEVEDVEFGEVDDRNDDGGYMSELDDSDRESEEDEDEFKIDEDDTEAPPLKMQILPLYSLLPTREQLRVFEPVDDGTRQVVIATNVAETSLTIPGIRYVFDCGRSKERQYDKISGVQNYEVGWVSKASANQRAGRAGRTGPGHCYRLYSSAVYDRDLPQFTDPELLRMPIDGVVLQLKAMNLQNVVNFPFPTPPERKSLARGEKLLEYLSALSSSGAITQVGKTMSLFPLSPRFSRILLVGHQQNCLHYTIALIAALSAGELFVPEHQAIPSVPEKAEGEILTNAQMLAEDRQAIARKKYNAVHANFCSLDDKSDAIKLLQVVGEFAHDPTEEWCEAHFVRFKVLKEIQALRQQLVDLLKVNIAAFTNLKFEDKLDRPSEKQVKALKEMVTAGFIDQVAIRADLSQNPPEMYRKPRRAIDVPYRPLKPIHAGSKDPADGLVYIHPSSPMAHISIQECPEYIVYNYLQRSAPKGSDLTKKPKTRMHSLTDITGRELAALAKGTPLVSYGKPIKEVQMPPQDGAAVRECWVVPYMRAEGETGLGWPLPVVKMKQKRVLGKGWEAL
ncbi:probable ECM16 - putative DEAH-box RNA helicase [Cephalotrichum gorgonifer]|uniref:RNA helicase n=1 Tax=Cephalotrichum gorgonifer TaxID=2041049 RepID=A0AAE8STR4_9PEZI|nr:probable ECM16 - putative DEAH-box RNA helicase [Cephalotrichum gorgonifer]